MMLHKACSLCVPVALSISSCVCLFVQILSRKELQNQITRYHKVQETNTESVEMFIQWKGVNHQKEGEIRCLRNKHPLLCETNYQVPSNFQVLLAQVTLFCCLQLPSDDCLKSCLRFYEIYILCLFNNYISLREMYLSSKNHNNEILQARKISLNLRW